MRIYDIIEESRQASAEILEILEKQALEVHPNEREELLRFYLIGALLLDLKGGTAGAKKISISNVTIEKSDGEQLNKYWRAYNSLKKARGIFANKATVSVI